MKRLVIVVLPLLLVAACTTAASGPPGPTGSVTGAATPQAAVELFLGAIKAQDLQAMSAIWGGRNGLARDLLPRDELEKRELTMQCYLAHDQYRVLSAGQSGGSTRAFQVSLTRGPITRTTTITATKGPSDRWYVEDADLAPLQDLCSGASGR